MSPSLKEVWFFRPFFKGLVGLCYSLFKNQIGFWMMIHWGFVMGAAILGEFSLQRIKKSHYRPFLFFLLFIVSFSLHFANVVWVGEGMMNAPQLFLLALAVFFFVSSSHGIQWLSIFPYLFALGFKESSAFLPILLWVIALHQKEFSKKKVLLGAHFFIFCGFLVFRLGLLPFNPAYQPLLSFRNLMDPLFYFLVCLGFPFSYFLWNVSNRKQIPRNWKSLVLSFLPFLGLLLAPHLGHPFFSPGWTLLPGYFFLWVICFVVNSEQMTSKNLYINALVVLALSSLVVGTQIWNLKWLSWVVPQRKMHSLLVNTDPNVISQIKIKNCLTQEYPDITFQRVIGAKENLEFMWALHHSKPIDFKFIECEANESDSNDSLLLTWKFPDLIIN